MAFARLCVVMCCVAALLVAPTSALVRKRSVAVRRDEEDLARVAPNVKVQKTAPIQLPHEAARIFSHAFDKCQADETSCDTTPMYFDQVRFVVTGQFSSKEESTELLSELFALSSSAFQATNSSGKYGYRLVEIAHPTSKAFIRLTLENNYGSET